MSVGIFNYLETSDSSKVFKYTVDVFADLATLTEVEELDLAFVSTTTGVFGFRNLKGLYQYKGGAWVYATKDLQDLAIAQQAEIDNNEQAITDLENTKVDSVTGDGVDNTDPLNPVISQTGGGDSLYTADGEVSSTDRVSNWTNQGTLQFNVFDSGTTNFNNKSGVLIEDNNTTIRAQIGDGAGNATNTTELLIESDRLKISSDLTNFNGIEYDADYSANFTDRTLIDKGYLDSQGGSFYTQDGTINGDRTVLLDNFGEFELFSFNGPIATNNGAGIFKIKYDSFEIGFVDTSAGTIENNFKYVPGVGFQLQDDSLGVGIRYFADYSANYGDRSLVDKAFVVNEIANIGTDFVPLPTEGTQGNSRSIAILNNDGDEIEYTSDIKIDEFSKQTFFRHGDQTSSAHEIVFRDSADQDQFIINKDKTPAYLQSISGNNLRLNDYTFPETGDSFTFPTTDGTDGQVMTTDGAGNLSFEDLRDGYTIFPIWAEDNSPLENSGLEWSFGNGGKSNNQIPIPVDCELFAFTFHAAASSGSASINILKRTNGVSNVIVTSDTFTGTEANTQIFTTPYPWSIGEPVHFRTDTVTGTVTNVRVCAWFRVKATSQSTSLLGELLDVSLPSPTIGDVLSYDGTNWGAAPGATATIKTASFMSTVAQDVGTATNGIGTNIQINLTNVLGPNSIGYGLSSGNITIPAAGWYKVSLKSLTTTTTTGRQNTSFVVKRNSVDITGTKVAGYNRNTANNTASATLCPTIPQFQFAQGDTIGLYAISGGDNSQTSLTVSQECILTLELI